MALVLLAIAGAAVMAYFTRRGIGLWEDSFDYITAARTLVESGRLGRIDGFGNFRPMTHFPPAYPWALALFDSAGLDIYSAARWLNVGLFGLTILLTGTCLRKATGSTRWGIVGAALVLSSEVLIGVHLWALTEPMYLTLALSSILLEAEYLRSPRRYSFLPLAALMSAFALLTRYAAVATVTAGAGVLVFLPGRSRARRWQDALAYLLISCLPLAAFLLRNRVVSGAPTDYPRAVWQLPLVSEWELVARTVSNWWVPDFVVEHLSRGMALAALSVPGSLTILGAAWLLRGMWRDWKGEAGGSSGVGILLLSYGGAYLLVFLSAGVFIRTVVLSDNRVLSPLYLALVAVVVIALAPSWRMGTPTVRVLLIGACLVFACFQARRLAGLLEVLPNDSRGFASNTWRQSETIASVRNLPNTLIFSNEIQAIYFLTGRTAIFVPSLYNPATGQPREDFDASLAEMRTSIQQATAVLVLFGGPGEGESEEYFAALSKGLPLLGQFNDGAIYGRGTGLTAPE